MQKLESSVESLAQEEQLTDEQSDEIIEIIQKRWKTNFHSGVANACAVFYRISLDVFAVRRCKSFVLQEGVEILKYIRK